MFDKTDWSFVEKKEYLLGDSNFYDVKFRAYLGCEVQASRTFVNQSETF